MKTKNKRDPCLNLGEKVKRVRRIENDKLETLDLILMLLLQLLTKIPKRKILHNSSEVRRGEVRRRVHKLCYVDHGKYPRSMTSDGTHNPRFE